MRNNKKVYSYGIIPIFKDIDNYRILIVKNSKGGHWGLPKGTPEKNEKPIQTANRELFEETGLKNVKVEVGLVFTEPSYSFEVNNIKYTKTNKYFVSFVNKMIVSDDLDEIDEAKWVTFKEAEKTLTHKSIIKVVRDLENHLMINSK